MDSLKDFLKDSLYTLNWKILVVGKHQICKISKSTKWFPATKIPNHKNPQPPKNPTTEFPNHPNSPILEVPPKRDMTLKYSFVITYSEDQVPPNHRTTRIPPNHFQPPKFSTTKIPNHQNFQPPRFPPPKFPTTKIFATKIFQFRVTYRL